MKTTKYWGNVIPFLVPVKSLAAPAEDGAVGVGRSLHKENCNSLFLMW